MCLGFDEYQLNGEMRSLLEELRKTGKSELLMHYVINYYINTKNVN